jgi:hypothetical protein
VSDIADKRRVIAEEIFAWAEMIIVLLDRMIVALRVQDLGNEQRRELSLRARQIERLFVQIQEIVEIHDEADLGLGGIDRLFTPTS